MAKSIYEMQSDPLLVKCLFAQRAKYSLAKIVFGLYLAVCVVSAAVFSILDFYISNNFISGLSLGLSFAAAFASDSVLKWVNKLKKEAARIQNYFDITLYAESNNTNFWHNMMSKTEICEFVSKYPNSGFCDKDKWYEDFSSLPHHLQVVHCQEENLYWDSDLRKKYYICCRICFYTIVFALVMTAILLDLSFLAFLSLCSWATPFIKCWIEFSKKMKDDEKRISRIKEGILAHLQNQDRLIDRDSSITWSIKWQDKIYNHRCNAILVPDFFYKLFRNKQQDQMLSIASDVNDNNGDI